MEERASTDMYIANDCHINGGIRSSSNVTIDGQVEGSIIIKGNLVVGESGKIKADIEAENVYIKGEVHGKITAKTLLEISSTGNLFGDISTKFLKIDKGAKFIGTSSHPDEQGQPQADPIDAKFVFKPTIYNRLAK